MVSRILIVEDEPRIISFLEKGLQANGFTTLTASDANEALEIMQTYEFDLLLLDLGLPGKDGLIFLEELRGQGQNVPIIILSARNDINDKVMGLEGGANDYITKPFRFEELLARVRARLRDRHSSKIKVEQVLRSGSVVLDLRTRQAKVGDRPVDLSAREFILAETFFRHPGQVMSREQLIDTVWGYDYYSSSNVVDVYVGYLRKKLGSDLIETVRGMGYRLRIDISSPSDT